MPSTLIRRRTLHTKEIGKYIFQVDLETGGFRNLICSYIIKSEETIVVESGPTSSVSKLLEGLKELNICFQDVKYVAVTHVHLDHGGGVGTLLKSLPNAKVIVHPKGMPHLIDPEKLWLSSQSVLGFISEVFGKPEPVPPERIIPMTEGLLDLGKGARLRIIETPGHASHNLSYHETFNGGIFPGDAAGTYFQDFDVVAPTTPPPFYLDSALSSLDRLISFSPTFLYYSHFGKASNAVQRLKEYKEQLQLWAKIAIQGVLNDENLEEISSHILAEDRVMQKIGEYVKNHKIYSKTVLENCVEGFIGYAKQTLAKQQAK